MKTKKILLCLLVLFAINMPAMSKGRMDTIKLHKHLSTTGNVNKRSVDFIEVSAYLNDELLLIQSGYNCVNIEVSIIDLATNEVVCFESSSFFEDIVLNIAGLEMNNRYRLEIIIEDTVLYGDFSI